MSAILASVKASDFWCENRGCAQRGRLKTLPWRNSDQYPFCDACGKIMRENVSAPSVIWTGEIDHRYRDKTKDGYHNSPGQWAYTRKTPDGKPKAVRLNTWQDVSEHCKREGLRDPRECGNNIEVAENGKDLVNTCGMPGTEI